MNLLINSELRNMFCRSYPFPVFGHNQALAWNATVRFNKRKWRFFFKFYWKSSFEKQWSWPLLTSQQPRMQIIHWLLPGTWSHLMFTGVRECPPWCSIVGATVTVHQFCCILHTRVYFDRGYGNNYIRDQHCHLGVEFYMQDVRFIDFTKQVILVSPIMLYWFHQNDILISPSMLYWSHQACYIDFTKHVILILPSMLYWYTKHVILIHQACYIDLTKHVV